MRLQTALSLCFLSTYLLSQDSSTSARFSLGAAAGIAHYNVTSYRFTGILGSFPLKPRYSAAATITYGIVSLVDQAGLEISVQASYSYSSTGSVNWSGIDAESKWEFSEIMLWPRLIVSGNLSPFIEIGVGLGSVTANEQYSNSNIEQVQHSTTGPKLGIGGGITLRLSNCLRMDGYSQTIHFLKTVEFSANRNTWISCTPATFILGARIVYSL